MTNKEFRLRLQKITDGCAEDNIKKQPLAIAALRMHIPHSILLLRAADHKAGFNCFALCFGIEKSAKMQELARYRNIIPSSAYAQYLIEEILEEIDKSDQQDGDYIIYLHDGRPTHAGILFPGYIVSKWGSHGHVWKHGMWEVPYSYGETARLFRRLPDELCEPIYLDWANHSKGI